MSDDTLGRDWAAQAEKLLVSLKTVAGASITLTRDGTAISEINILAEGQRPAKQIVRDVRSALKAEFQLDVDYRKISVAQKRDSMPDDASHDTGQGPTVLALPSAYLHEEPAVLRLRYGRVSAVLDQSTCKVTVELSLGDRDAAGEASGASSRRDVPRLTAEATLDAVSKFLEPGYALGMGDVETVRVGDTEVILVVVKFYKDRSEKVLTGSCTAAHDLHQSVVYATLDALNRFLGRLRFKEPIEYEIRPTSLP